MVGRRITLVLPLLVFGGVMPRAQDMCGSTTVIAESSPASASAPCRGGQQPGNPPQAYSVRVNVNSVFLNVVVSDRITGRSVVGLGKEDFLVYENGVLQQVDQFRPSQVPLNLLLLLDVSGSTGLYLNLMKGASADFIRKMKNNDRVAIATFSSRVDLVQNFTGDRTRAEQAIQRIWAGGGTSFYDALMACVDRYMKGVEGRSAIVVFSDGIDNQLEGGYPAGSQTTFDELYHGVQEAEPTIYPIFLDTVRQSAAGTPEGSGTRTRRVPTLDRSKPNPDDPIADDGPASYDIAVKQLRMIAEQTGGRMYAPRRIEELSDAYSDIASDLFSQYQLGYNPTNSAMDGGWREIRVKIRNRPDAVVRTRKGYFAVKDNGR
jgi:Ca-activated chloride channel family protein